MSAVSAYYYLRLVIMMYFKDYAGTEEPSEAKMAMGAVVLSALAVVLMGLFPFSIIDVTSKFF
jgi:NADH:ubiquinone oxidoreductase subunit 2 (subunit N)